MKNIISSQLDLKVKNFRDGTIIIEIGRDLLSMNLSKRILKEEGMKEILKHIPIYFRTDVGDLAFADVEQYKKNVEYKNRFLEMIIDVIITNRTLIGTIEREPLAVGEDSIRKEFQIKF